MANDTDSVPGLLDSITLVDAAISLAESALLDNPSKEDERSLNRSILRLQAERASLDAQLDAALASETAVLGPSPAQLAVIESLTAQVEKAAAATATVSAGIALSGKVIDLMAKVVSK